MTIEDLIEKLNSCSPSAEVWVATDTINGAVLMVDGAKISMPHGRTDKRMWMCKKTHKLVTVERTAKHPDGPTYIEIYNKSGGLSDTLVIDQFLKEYEPA